MEDKKWIDKEEWKKQKISQYYKTKHWKKQEALRNNVKGKNDISYRLMQSLVARVWIALNKCNRKLHMKHNELVGCSRTQLVQHLSSQFTTGMTLENYGEWEIDHIKPIALCEWTEESMKEIFNYKNLQPLWMQDNRKKSAKYDLSIFDD